MSYSIFLQEIEGVAKQVRELENKSSQALYEQKNEDEYRNILKQKAELLASLPKIGEQAGLPEQIEKRLKKFANSAKQALEIGSIFYMSALLYPENYQEGQPNDLENFITEARQFLTT